MRLPRSILVPVRAALLALWIQLLLLQSANSAFAVPVSADDVSVKAPSCSKLIAGQPQPGVATAKPPDQMSPAASRFLSLVDLAMGGPEFAMQSDHEAIHQVSESSVPLNPFLNAKGPFGLAVRAQIEPLVEAMTPADWATVQVQLQRYVYEQNTSSEQRDIDSKQTQAVSTFEYFPFIKIPAPNGASESFRSFQVKPEFLGQTSSGHYVFRFGNSNSDGDFGIVSFSQRADSSGLPEIKWITRHGVAWNSKQFAALSPDQQQLSRAQPGKFWVIKGRLYAALRPTEPASDVWVEVDPATGQIVDRLPLPSKGIFGFWKASTDQILAIRFGPRSDQNPSLVGHEVFRFLPDDRILVPTGLNIAAMGIAEFCQTGTKAAGNFEMLDCRNEDVRLGPQDVYINWARRNRFGDKSGIIFDYDAMIWSETEVCRGGVRTGVLPADAKIPRQLRVLLQSRYARLSPEDFWMVASVDRSEWKATRGPDRWLSLDFDSPERGNKFEVHTVPLLRKNVIFYPSSRSVGDLWLVDTDTLQSIKMPTPDNQISAWEVDLGSRFQGYNVKTDTSGQIVLIGFNTDVGRSVSWVFNMKTMQFDQPQMGLLPVSQYYPTRKFLFAADQRSVVGEIHGQGISLLQTVTVKRTDAP